MKVIVPIRVIRVFKLVQYLCEFPPKTVDKLAEMLEISPKTVYKDIHIVEAVGYEIDKDENHKYYIKNSGRTEYQLDEQEKKLIIATIQKTGLTSMEVQSIVQKLKTKQMVIDVRSLNIMKQLQLIKILIDAISLKLPIIIKNYKSTSSGAKAKDRYVLPLYFDEMRMSLTAYDIDKEQSRIFKVSRMTGIEPLSTPIIQQIPNEVPIVDMFGFAGEMKYDISLLLTKRSATILKEEFILAENHVSESNDITFPYFFKGKVCGYEGVGRFVLGMITEIKVLGDDGFKLYLKRKLSEMTIL